MTIIRTLQLHSIDSLHTNDFRNFISKIYGQEPIVLLVTAEWCGHCTHFKPEVKKAIQNTNNLSKKGDKTITLVDMNDQVASHLSEHAKENSFCNILASQVRGFPTFMSIGVISKSKNTIALDHFNDERNASAVSVFIKKVANSKKEQPPQKTVTQKKQPKKQPGATRRPLSVGSQQKKK